MPNHVVLQRALLEDNGEMDIVAVVVDQLVMDMVVITNYQDIDVVVAAVVLELAL